MEVLGDLATDITTILGDLEGMDSTILLDSAMGITSILGTGIIIILGFRVMKNAAIFRDSEGGLFAAQVFGGHFMILVVEILLV